MFKVEILNAAFYIYQ